MNMKKDTAEQRPGGRYLENEDVDSLARMSFELLSELWIVRDRMAILEQVLSESNVLNPNAIDAYVPDAALSSKLEAMRNIMVENVVGAPLRYTHTVETLKAQGRAIMEAQKVKP